MRKFLEWLHKDLGKAALVGSVLFVIMLYYSQANLIVAGDIFIRGAQKDPTSVKKLFSLLGVLVIEQLGTAFWEELIFRVIPILVTLSYFSIYSVLVVIIAVSTLFGYMHGGIVNIFLQGMFGFYMSILFLKAGALQKKHLRAFLAIVIVHAIVNLIFIFSISSSFVL